MTTVNLPEVNAPVTGAQQAVGNAAQRALLLTQMTSAGTAVDGALNLNPSLAQIKVLGGNGGMGYDAADKFREINEITPLDVIFKDDPTGGATEKNLTFTGTATGVGGTLEIGVGSSRNGIVSVGVSAGDTAAEIATAVAAAYASVANLVATIAVDGTETTQVNATFNHDGLEGNAMPFYCKGYVPGITYAITVGTAGTGTVTTTDIFDAIGDTRYDMIVAPASWGVAYLETLLDDRWNVANKIVDGCAVLTNADTYDNYATLGATLNSKGTAPFIAGKLEARTWYHGMDIFENPLAISAMYAAIETLKRTDDEDVSSYVSSAVDQGDLIGGIHMASLPKFNTPLPLPVQNTGFGWSGTEPALLNGFGFSVIGNNVAGNTVLMGEAYTMYKTDTLGNPDVSFRFKNYVDTSSAGREYIATNMRAAFGQHRLTGGQLAGNLSMANAASIRSKILRLCADLGNVGILQKGPVAKETIDSNLTITPVVSTGQVSCTIKKFPIVTQLRGFYIPIEITFNI